MPLQARCHSLRPERMSSWLAFFELTPRSRRGGHFLVVGPADDAHPEGREAALRAGQAAVRYFKETPDGAPAGTLLEGVAAVVRHESAHSGLTLEYGCGVLLDDSIWVLTRGRVRLVQLAPHLQPPTGADEPLEIPAAAQGRVFFGRLPVEFDDPRIFRDMAARLEQAGGGDGGLLVSFAEGRGPRAGSPTRPAAPLSTLPLFEQSGEGPVEVEDSSAPGVAGSSPSEVAGTEAVGETRPPTPPAPGPAPPRERPAPAAPPAQDSPPDEAHPGSRETAEPVGDSLAVSAPEAEDEIEEPGGGIEESPELEVVISEVEAEAAELSGDEAPDAELDPPPVAGTPENGDPAIPGVYAPEETRGLGFWLGLVAVLLVLGAGITYFGFVRGRLPSPVGERSADSVSAVGNEAAISGGGVGEQVSPRIAWTETFEKAVTSSPLILDAMVVFGCRDGNVYALDRSTGRRAWAYGAPDGFGSSPAAGDGLVFIGGYDGKLYALDAATGAERWVLPTGGRIVASPVVAGGTVFIGSYDHKLYAVSTEDGAVRWTRDLGSILWASPVTTDELVIAADLGGKVSALETTTGRERWVANTQGEVYSSPAVGERKVFVGSKDKHLYAFDLEDGAQLWKVAASSEVNGSPAYNQGRVVVGTDDGTLLGIDVGLGLAVWSIAAEGPVKSRPVFEGPRVWVTGYDGILRAIEWLTGEEVVRFDIGTSAFSSPALADENLFFGGMDGRFFSVSIR